MACMMNLCDPNIVVTGKICAPCYHTTCFLTIFVSAVTLLTPSTG